MELLCFKEILKILLNLKHFRQFKCLINEWLNIFRLLLLLFLCLFSTQTAYQRAKERDFTSIGLGGFENEALENEDRSTKHPDLKSEAPKSRKRSTQNSKTKRPKLENEAPKTRKQAPKTRNHSRLKINNFKPCMTQAAESGGGDGSYMFMTTYWVSMTLRDTQIISRQNLFSSASFSKLPIGLIWFLTALT